MPRNQHKSLPVSKPLLSQAEISELIHRAQELSPSQLAREVAHTNHGENESVYRGSGMDFDDSRPFQFGDEIKHINWRLSARSSEHYIKLFREERHPGTFILIDRRYSMRFGTRTRLKVTQGARAAVLLASIAHNTNAAIGAVLLDDSLNNKPCWINEKTGNAAFQYLIDSINKPCPPTPENNRQPDIAHTLSLMQAMLTRGSDVILISDFFDLDTSSKTVLAQLANTHRLRTIYILDPAEPALPDTGRLRIVSGNQQQSRIIDTGNSVVSREYASAAQQHINTRKQLFASLNIPCTPLFTDTDDITNALFEPLTGQRI